MFSTNSVTACAQAPSGSKEVVASQIPPRTSSPTLSGLLGASEALRILGLEQEPGEHLEARANSTEAVIQHLGETEITESETLRLEEGRIVLSPASMEELPDEVDSWTGFTQFFRHDGGARSRNPDLVRHVYAAILAQACNFGLTTMADIADLTYRQLAWTTDWYLREETLKVAFSALVCSPPKLAVSSVVGFIKGKSAISIARNFMGWKRNFTGESFWARGYFGTTVGLEEEVVREYIRRQEQEEQRLEQLNIPSERKPPSGGY